MSTDRLEVDRTTQFDLFEGPSGGQAPRRYGASTRRRFVAPDPREIYLGQTRLDEHLRASGQLEPLAVAALLDEQDWSEFEARYACSGRAPYAPRCMLGLILYGVMRGVTSLRGLEQLARRDLGGMWVSGGIQPDHANVGRFITLHEASLSGSLFEALTRRVLEVMGSHGQRCAGDATVIEAACSHYRVLHEEAAREAAREARRRANRAPDDAARRQAAERAEAVAATASERAAVRAAKGKANTATRVSATEPEASVQPLKRARGYAPAYRASILANEDRVIVGLDCHPTSETAVLAGLLDQHERIHGAAPGELLLDAGYCSDGVIATALERDIGLLCPQGKKAGQARQSHRYYPKDRFRYEAHDDVYICPAGERLAPIERSTGRGKAPAYVLYGTAACAACPWRTYCTRSNQGRRIRRYGGDDAKDALRSVMEHPQAQARFRRRQAMVEPIFGAMRLDQGLERFRRRGLAGIRREFALHALAHNLGRAVKRLGAFADGAHRPLHMLRALLCAWRQRLTIIAHPQRFETLSSRRRTAVA